MEYRDMTVYLYLLCSRYLGRYEDFFCPKQKPEMDKAGAEAGHNMVDPCHLLTRIVAK